MPSIRATHVEKHNDAKNEHRFWRCYELPGWTWVAQWGRVGAPTGQYKLFGDSAQSAQAVLGEKFYKGYGNPQVEVWECTDRAMESVLNGRQYYRLGDEFNRRLGGTFVPSLEETIAGLQAIRDDLTRQ